ncbi:hypothetical protein ACG83_10525 [Frankia sp. R43]|uniref:hypothetical protein n=1 Tax=Frankia sp. R43 TaxID=269536 RepID=UPI0006CA2A56|nr:hypothetical protein [Frankia sp. R43]KPM55709.1 hypothetical protein ACG83_10525 [Frankia sp. R43]
MSTLTTEDAVATQTIDDVLNHLDEAFGDADLVSTDTGETAGGTRFDPESGLLTVHEPDGCPGRPRAYFRVTVEPIPLVEGPQVLDGDANPPHGQADTEPGAEVSRYGRTGMVLGWGHRHNLERGDAELIDIAPAPASMSDAAYSALWLAVAWGVPAGTSPDGLDDSYERAWIPAAGTVATRTWYPAN